jgi:F-type H+-transporting ATPase subunit delta
VRKKDRELSATYANAIYETALEGWLTSLKAVDEGLSRDETIAASLREATLELSQRQDIARKVMPQGASEEVVNFVSLLISKNHIHLLGDVILQLERLSRQGPRPRVARVTTAVPLAAKERERVENFLTARFGGGLEFGFLVDESILGGLIARVGDEIIDDSIAAKLAALRQSVVAAE